jgi:hypothetical protein
MLATSALVCQRRSLGTQHGGLGPPITTSGGWFPSLLTSSQASAPGSAGKATPRRPPLTLALLCALVGQGAWWAGSQTLPLVQVETPLAPDAEVLAEAAFARGPTFCNRAGDTLDKGGCQGRGPHRSA